MAGNFHVMNDYLATSLADTHRVLGILEGLVSVIADREIIADLILFQESCFTKIIDYSDFDIRSMLMEKPTKIKCQAQNKIFVLCLTSSWQ